LSTSCDVNLGHVASIQRDPPSVKMTDPSDVRGHAGERSKRLKTDIISVQALPIS
jgi:hypothetical protein